MRLFLQPAVAHGVVGWVARVSQEEERSLQNGQGEPPVSFQNKDDTYSLLPGVIWGILRQCLDNSEL